MSVCEGKVESVIRIDSRSVGGNFQVAASSVKGEENGDGECACSWSESESEPQPSDRSEPVMIQRVRGNVNMTTQKVKVI